MELLGIQGEHVAVGQRLGSENRREQLFVVAYVLCCVPTHLQQTALCVFAGQPAAAASASSLGLQSWGGAECRHSSTVSTADCSVAEAATACQLTNVCIT